MIEELLVGGLVVVRGPPGAGKTTLVARAVSGLSRVAWFTFYETAERLRRGLEGWGIRPPSHLFDLVSLGRPGELAQFVAAKVLELDPQAVVVDGVNALGGGRELAHALLYHGISRDRPVILIKEGVETDPLDYIADTVIQLDYQLLQEGTIVRRLRIVKARGRQIRHHTYPLVMAEGGPLVVSPPAGRLPSGERHPTGWPALDEALGGGILRGSLVAVVGPEDGLASKSMANTAVRLASQGLRILYEHHKPNPTFLKWVERLGLDWRVGVEWSYHHLREHMTAECGHRLALEAAGRGADIHFADQYELVASTVGPRLLADEVEIYLSTAERPPTRVLVFNSPEVWRAVQPVLGSLVDYLFQIQHGRLVASAPDLDEPLRFVYRIDWRTRQVDLVPEG